MNAAVKILIIIADDFGWGNVGINTPNILQLMSESRVYSNAHAPVSWCAPTRWALMTGRYPYTKTPQITNPVTSPLLSATAPTLARHMKVAGYRTGIFGKWHLGGSPLNHGFQTAFWYPNANVSLYGSVTLRDQSRPVITTRAKFLDQICNRAVRFMQGSEPWFAYVALPTPHRPIVGSYSEWVGACDTAVGQLVDAAGPDSLVIFTSDNGTEEKAGIANEVPNPNRGWKRSLYDGGTRVPFCIRHPDLEPGETDQLVSLHDIPATLGAMIGFVANSDSVDIFGIPRSNLITQDVNRKVAVRRSDGWKLHIDSMMLYHLPSDPKESSPVDDSEIAAELLWLWVNR